ncbi:MAG: hypothetical protein HN350_13000 [Phycisphaerales bacterium]|jgi:hypothetical protein|nr:hypothetical protein [Phycisphaerales bacterium]
MEMIRPMTKKQLQVYVADYAHVFPASEWTPVEGCAFIRTSGPVQQYVGFENLRSGAYRPVMMISTTAGPKRVVHAQDLDIKHREVFPREHDRMRDSVMQAMKEQFKPLIHNPLDPEEVLILCEREAPGKINDCSGLAAINAYLGHTDRALQWCDRLEIAQEELGRELADWERKLIKFGYRLREAIGRGDERSFLETMIE